jgi:transposase InsO family protein
VIGFMQAHKREFGVEPMCRVLQIAPSTWYEHARRKADPGRLPRRAKRDGELSVHIRRVFEENFGVYGVRKVWRQLRREDIDVARCTVARLMKAMGLQGVVRGKRMKTTINDKATPCPLATRPAACSAHAHRRR